MDSLEKRVKSRLEHRQITFFFPRSLGMLVEYLKVEENATSQVYVLLCMPMKMDTCRLFHVGVTAAPCM